MTIICGEQSKQAPSHNSQEEGQDILDRGLGETLVEGRVNPIEFRKEFRKKCKELREGRFEIRELVCESINA